LISCILGIFLIVDSFETVICVINNSGTENIQCTILLHEQKRARRLINKINSAIAQR
jgi:hypothetical protein